MTPDWAPIANLTIAGVAILTNMLLAAMFLCRARGLAQMGMRVGAISLALGLPLAAAAAANAWAGQPWWTFVLPAPLILYDAVEFGLDYVWHSRFRETAWLGPYLGLYYLALMLMIGAAFLVGRLYGYITLAAYFVNLAATAYAYRRVGHG